MVFPEIDADKVGFSQGMNIAVVTTCESNADALALLIKLGFPFQRIVSKDKV